MNIKRQKNGRYQLRWRDETGKQRARNFRTKELAQDEMRALHRGKATARPTAKNQLTLGDVVQRWKADCYTALGEGTKVRYDNLLRLYFEDLQKVEMAELTPARVDEWIAWMKSDPDRYKKARHRTSFHHELTLLKTILSYYDSYCDDDSFRSPVKARHRVAIRLRNRPKSRPKDLSEADFFAFRQRLEADFGLPVAVLATLQYYDALRISEAVPLRWSNVRFDWTSPRRSRLIFDEHVVFARSKAVRDFVEPGLKNRDDGKEHPMLPEVFTMLRRLWKPGAKGLVFAPPRGDQDFFSYRQVQYRYNKTFERLGLAYSSTHIMRHGGTRKTFDETGGDYGIAGQQLGNSDRKSIETYAQRSVHAFTSYAARQWDLIELGSARNVHSAAVGLKTISENS